MKRRVHLDKKVEVFTAEGSPDQGGEQSVYQTAALNRQQNILEIHFHKIERIFKVSAASSNICRHDFELSTF